ncbi:MAG: flagellar motor switch protein FliN [Erythrobacter sp.]|nr:flagellar motor switch protein FliN [Erythrobacter sp.]
MTDKMRALDLISDVEVMLSVELGRTRMPLKDVLGLVENAVVPLERQVDELLDVYVNGKAIARGEVITEGDRFALRVVELAGDRRGAEAA